MRPPLLGFIPKVVPEGGETILGQYVPGGTAIGTNLSAITRSTKIFGPDAELYRPERLMELRDKPRKQMERDIELTFGYGQWMCVGKSIALMEINKVVFEVSLSTDQVPVNNQFPSTAHQMQSCSRYQDDLMLTVEYLEELPNSRLAAA